MIPYLQGKKKPKRKFRDNNQQLYHNNSIEENQNSYKVQYQQRKKFFDDKIIQNEIHSKNINQSSNKNEKIIKVNRKENFSFIVRIDYFKKLIVKENPSKILQGQPLSNRIQPSTCYKEHSYQEDKNTNARPQMEDFHKIVSNFIPSELCSYFAIFDGHGGDNTAIYCKDNFDICLKKFLQSTNFEVGNSLTLSFNQIDLNVNKILTKENCGSTATIALIYKDKKNHKRKITCANVGDSKCFLLKKSMKCIMLSTDHKCDNPNEVERIKKTGGLVFNGRVFGSLIISRSIGNKEMKNYGVISTPSITTVEIDDKDDNYLIIASDGVWDIVNNEKLIELCKVDIPAEEMSKLLVKMSIDGGTADNVSCIVVKLN